MSSSPPVHLQGLPDWTPRRQQLHSQLADRAAPLAGLYAANVILLATPEWPGRHHLLGHCVREVAQRLPEFLDSQLHSRAPRDEALRSFAAAWRSAGLPTDGEGFALRSERLEEESSDGLTVTAPAPDIEVVVPMSVARAAATLVATDEQLSANNYDKAAAIILNQPISGVAAAKDRMRTVRDATVLQWTDTTKWFLRFTHVKASHDQTLPSEEELRHRFEIIESTLEAVLAPFYDVIDDLDEILSVANTPAAASYADESVCSGIDLGGDEA